MSKPVEQVRKLSVEERARAKDKARTQIAGKKPVLKYTQKVSKYPPEIVRFIEFCCWLVLVAAFLPSAFRLFAAGQEAFIHGMNEDILATIVGGCTVILAEISLVVCTITLSISESAFSKKLMWAGAIIATVVALFGNISVAKLHTINIFEKPFYAIEAIVPSIIALFMSYILKERRLDSVEEKFRTEMQFKLDEEKWHETYDKAENMESDTWRQAYALALRDMIYTVNNRLKLGKEYLPKLTDQDWLFLVNRELAADTWFVDALSNYSENMPDAQSEEPYDTNQQSDTMIIVKNNGIEYGYVDVLPTGKWAAYCGQCGTNGLPRVVGEGYANATNATQGLQRHYSHQHRKETQ